MMCLCLTIVCADGRRRRKHDDESEDFEFADDSQNDYDYQRDQLYPWEKVCMYSTSFTVSNRYFERMHRKLAFKLHLIDFMHFILVERLRSKKNG